MVRRFRGKNNIKQGWKFIELKMESIKQKLKKLLFPLLNIRDNRRLLRWMGQGIVKIGHSRLIDCSFEIHGNGSMIFVGDGCVLKGLHCLVVGDNSKVIIGDNVHINASKRFPTIMNAFDGARIVIGDDCLFSNSIELHTTDYHSIIRKIGGGKINPPQDIIIDRHVWIGLRTIVLKGVHIATDNVVGAGSIVTKSFDESNTIIVGNPAKVIKNDINWDIKNLPIENNE